MDRTGFVQQILALDVFDTHTHLVGGKLASRDFWDIAEYFWFAEELWAAGYPKDADKLPESTRWFSFRASTYRDSMQKCLEALPPAKRSLVASDARHIEWCYGKVMLVKTLLAEFLSDQIDRGWIDEEEALRVAREWLHDSAARRYGVS